MATKALTAQIKDKQEYMARATPPFIMSIISLSTHQKYPTELQLRGFLGWWNFENDFKLFTPMSSNNDFPLQINGPTEGVLQNYVSWLYYEWTNQGYTLTTLAGSQSAVEIGQSRVMDRSVVDSMSVLQSLEVSCRQLMIRHSSFQGAQRYEY